MNCDRFVFYILSTKRDWLCSLFRFQFCHLAYLRFSAELFLFVIFSTFSFVFVQLFLFYRLSSRSLRYHYLTLFLFNIRLIINRFLLMMSSLIKQSYRNLKFVQRINDKETRSIRSIVDLMTESTSKLFVIT
jgi:hypothetical protein